MRSAPTTWAAIALSVLAASAFAQQPAPPGLMTAPAAAMAPAAASVRGDFVFQGPMRQGGLVLGIVPSGALALTLDGAPIPIATDGRFVIGFGRDHGATATLVARFAEGDVVTRTLRIEPRAWNIQSMPTLARGTTPSPEFLRRRALELDQIKAARAIDAAAEGWRQRFLWPVMGRISGVFGSQRIYAGEPGAPHSGVDVARPIGTPVVAPADGVVILAAAAPFTLEGNLLMIDHGMGVNSAFLHLSRIDVKTGDRVTRGQLVGAIGTTGRSTGPHLHWGMKWRDERIDPAMLAGPMPAQ